MNKYQVGQRLRITHPIWDHGEDHHPPGWIAQTNEEVIIRGVNANSLDVSHEDVTDGRAFCVYRGEFELIL
jgi:hypothetical protein